MHGDHLSFKVQGQEVAPDSSTRVLGTFGETLEGLKVAQPRFAQPGLTGLPGEIQDSDACQCKSGAYEDGPGTRRVRTKQPWQPSGWQPGPGARARNLRFNAPAAMCGCQWGLAVCPGPPRTMPASSWLGACSFEQHALTRAAQPALQFFLRHLAFRFRVRVLKADQGSEIISSPLGTLWGLGWSRLGPLEMAAGSRAISGYS